MKFTADDINRILKRPEKPIELTEDMRLFWAWEISPVLVKWFAVIVAIIMLLIAVTVWWVFRPIVEQL